MRLGVLSAAFLLGGALTGLSLALVPRVDAALSQRGPLLVDGHVLAPDVPVRSFIERRGARMAGREAYVRFPEGLEQATFRELGIAVDVDATLAEVTRALPVRSPMQRLFEWVRREPMREPPSVPLSFRLDSAAGRQFLERLAPAVKLEPVNARLDLAAHRRIDDRAGRELDISATLANLDAGERRELAVFDAVFVPVEPAVTSADLLHVDVERVLSSFDTDFSKKPRSRIPNIKLAARFLNGVVVGPGEVMSFNRIVGPRTFERGFRDAPVIVADELEQGLGGGVCQVASTVFAAATLGGFEIVERRSHSRPSGYAPLGLDAAVIYPEVDLRLRNPHDSPVIIHAVVLDDKILRVELLGRDPLGKVEHFFGVEQRDPFERRVVVKPELPPGTVDRRQKGSQGYDGQSVIRTTLADGTRASRAYRSKYYPVPEVFWIAPDVKLETLPELPEGAAGVLLTDATAALDGERGDAPEP